MKHYFCALTFVIFATVCSQSFGELQCYRCYYSTCDKEVTDPSICTATKEFLKSLGTNLGKENDLPCPQPTDNWHLPQYMETCSGDKNYCGKRVIRINSEKYTNTSEGSSVGTLGAQATTMYPILRPQGPSIHVHTFTMYSCNRIEPECNRGIYSKGSYNKTLEGSPTSTLVFKAKLSDESDCTRCTVNLCNKDVPFDQAETSASLKTCSSVLIIFGIYFILQLSN